jgi:hypothetical protein
MSFNVEQLRTQLERASALLANWHQLHPLDVHTMWLQISGGMVLDDESDAELLTRRRKCMPSLAMIIKQATKQARRDRPRNRQD